MDRKEECDVQPEHLIESHDAMDPKAHEDHPDTLAEAVAHDKPLLDDRGTAKCCDPPQKE